MKKSSLVVVVLLVAASIGMTAVFSNQVSINGFLSSVYSTAFENHQTQNVHAQAVGTGSVTLIVQICQTLGNYQSPSGQTCSGTPASPSSDIAGQFKYDVQRLVGSGANTQITTVLSGVGAGTYTLPANTPNASNNNRDIYTAIEKSAPTNYDLIGTSGFTYPYNFSVTAGQSVEVDLPYVIYTAVEQTAPAGTTITADIVDGNGNFIRALTTSEIQSVTFDIQHSVPATGGNVGSHAGNFDTQVSSGKLNTSYSLPTYVHSGSILTNIKSPSGYVVRSINGGGANSGTYFDLGSVSSVVIHFTQAPASSQTQKADQMLYVPNGISYVKKIAQTYSDNEYKYSNLDVDMFAYHKNNNRPFPLNWAIAKYSGVPYLFLNGTGKIIIYNISDPANPKQVSEYVLSGLDNLNVFTRHTGAGDVTSGQCDPEHGGTHAFITSASKIFVADNSPYILVDVQRQGPGPAGTAILSLDTSSMAMTAHPQWTYCFENPNGVFGTAFGMYKGSDGKTYFVSQPFNNDKGYGITVSILSIDLTGVVTQVAVLNKSSGVSTSGVASDLDYNHGRAFVVSLGDKTYLIGPTASTVSNPNNLSVHIYDISNPQSISKINQEIVTTTGKIIIDGQSKRMYVPSSIPNPAANLTSYTIPKTLPIWQVYDLSVLPNAPKLIATYNNPTDLLNSTQISADFAQVAKRLSITSASNLIDTSNSSFIYGDFGYSSSVQLINVSNNLAYVSLYTNGKTQWDTIANQAGVTDGSEYGTNAIQFIVDLSNASSPKILGMIFGHTEYSAYALSAGGWFDVPLYGNIINYNGYIYRANFRIADVWKLGNPPVQNTGGGMSGGGTGVGAVTTIPSAPAFSFQSLLNIFRRILNNR